MRQSNVKENATDTEWAETQNTMRRQNGENTAQTGMKHKRDKQRSMLNVYIRDEGSGESKRAGRAIECRNMEIDRRRK